MGHMNVEFLLPLPLNIPDSDSARFDPQFLQTELKEYETITCYPQSNFRGKETLCSRFQSSNREPSGAMGWGL